MNIIIIIGLCQNFGATLYTNRHPIPVSLFLTI